MSFAKWAAKMPSSSIPTPISMKRLSIQFIPPTIFVDVTPEMRIAREEIFGPVLSVIKARDLDEAIEVANGTDYALTAGFFSRSPANIERAKAEIVAGNVYINRSCTGAVVGRHPFGGFKMSGGGTKAGGGDYLLNFLVPRVVTENIMRHGFAPEETPLYREEFLPRDALRRRHTNR